MEKNYFGFIYKWTDSTNGKTYTGSHYGSIDDGYTGSGKLFILAYKKRPNKFNREILEFIHKDDRKALLEAEQKYLNLIDWDNTYNLSAGAGGGHTTAGFTKEKLEVIRQKISKSLRGNTRGKGNKGRPKSKEQKQKHSEFMKGTPRTDEEKRKISNTLKGNIPWNKGKTNIYSEEIKQEMGKKNKGSIPWNKGKSTLEATRRKQSKSAKKRWKN